MSAWAIVSWAPGDGDWYPASAERFDGKSFDEVSAIAAERQRDHDDYAQGQGGFCTVEDASQLHPSLFS